MRLLLNKPHSRHWQMHSAIVIKTRAESKRYSLVKTVSAYSILADETEYCRKGNTINRYIGLDITIKGK